MAPNPPSHSLVVRRSLSSLLVAAALVTLAGLASASEAPSGKAKSSCASQCDRRLARCTSKAQHHRDEVECHSEHGQCTESCEKSDSR